MIQRPLKDSADVSEYCDVKIKEKGGPKRRGEELSRNECAAGHNTTGCQLARSESEVEV